MQRWAGGVVAKGLVDNYPLPAEDPAVSFTMNDVNRWLGIKPTVNEVVQILNRLEFTVKVDGETIIAQTPPHRLDIGHGIIGMADLMEEIARIYGYDRIPETRLSDELPPQRGNPSLELEETLRDLLVNLGLQEVITHRLTNPELENRMMPAGKQTQTEYVRIENPIASDRIVLRKSLLSSLLNIAERNSRHTSSMAFFELGQEFHPVRGVLLPNEQRKLAILFSGPRSLPYWQSSDQSIMDFYDIKGVIAGLLDALHIKNIHYVGGNHESFHPGKCSQIMVEDQVIGVFGEIHPQVQENFNLNEFPVLVAELDVEKIPDLLPKHYYVEPVPVFPPVLEDLAFAVDEQVQVQEIIENIRAAGGQTVANIQLFDVYRGGQAGEGKKSLAFSLTYQVPDRTLTDKEVARIRTKIIQQLKEKLGAELRG